MLLLCAVFLTVHCVYSCGNVTVVLENNLLALASLKHVTSIDVRTLQALDVIKVFLWAVRRRWVRRPKLSTVLCVCGLMRTTTLRTHRRLDEARPPQERQEHVRMRSLPVGCSGPGEAGHDQNCNGHHSDGRQQQVPAPRGSLQREPNTVLTQGWG